MSSLSELLESPSVENWKEIVEIGKHKLRMFRAFNGNDEAQAWSLFAERVAEGVKKWPPEIERLCPASWPKDFRDAIEHRVRETDTYGHYLAKICAHPDLRLSDGSQAAWLERRFTGGIVPVSTVQTALRTLSSALAASSVKTCYERIKLVINILSNGVRNVGKVGCADLTGGLTIEVLECATCETRDCNRGNDGKFRCFNDACPTSVEKVHRIEIRLEVEVKVGNEPQRPEQIARMNSVRTRGGCYVLARSVEEAVAEIKRFRDSR